jgi:hypothetical protein
MHAPRSSRRDSLVAVLLAIAQACCVPAVCSAQVEPAPLDRARDLLVDAEFDRAIRAYDDVLSGPLDRAQYVEALEGRATACWATGREDRARSDLALLAAIDPGHAFPLEAPPDLTALFASIVSERAGPLEIRARWSAEGSLVVSILHDDAALAQAIRVHAGDVYVVERAIEAGETTIEIGARGATSAWVELLGPTGAVLATAGDPAAPLVRAPTPEEIAAADTHGGSGSATPSADADPGADPDRDLWIGLGVGGGVLVAIGIVLAVVVATSGSGGAADVAHPSAPVVGWP